MAESSQYLIAKDAKKRIENKNGHIINSIMFKSQCIHNPLPLKIQATKVVFVIETELLWLFSYKHNQQPWGLFQPVFLMFGGIR